MSESFAEFDEEADLAAEAAEREAADAAWSKSAEYEELAEELRDKAQDRANARAARQRAREYEAMSPEERKAHDDEQQRHRDEVAAAGGFSAWLGQGIARQVDLAIFHGREGAAARHPAFVKPVATPADPPSFAEVFGGQAHNTHPTRAFEGENIPQREMFKANPAFETVSAYVQLSAAAVAASPSWLR